MTNQYIQSNSTTTPLGAGETFTGEWQDVESYPNLFASAESDVPGTLFVEFAAVYGGPVIRTVTFDVEGSVAEDHRLSNSKRFVRFRYVNNGTPQTRFSLIMRLGLFTLQSSPLNAPIQRDADASVVRSQPSFLEISTGKFTGIGKNNKSGKNSNIPNFTAANPLTGWYVIGENGAGITNYAGFPTGNAETLTIVSDSSNDTSGGSGAETVTVFGLDENWLVQSETITLAGLAGGTGSLLWRRVHSAYVRNSNNGANNGGNAGNLTIRHTTTTANVFLKMTPNQNQTYFSVFTVPSGKRGIITRTEVEVARNNSASLQGYYYVKESGLSARLRRPFSASNSSIHQEQPYAGNIYPAQTDIALVVTSCTAAATVFGQFDIVLVDDD